MPFAICKKNVLENNIQNLIFLIDVAFKNVQVIAHCKQSQFLTKYVQPRLFSFASSEIVQRRKSQDS